MVKIVLLMPSCVFNAHLQCHEHFWVIRAHPPQWRSPGPGIHREEEQPWGIKLLPMPSALPQPGSSSLCVIKSPHFSSVTFRELHIWPAQFISWFSADLARPGSAVSCSHCRSMTLRGLLLFCSSQPDVLPTRGWELGWVELEAAVQSLCRNKNPQL